MKNIWDERYAALEYVYGILPNKYFEEKIKNLPIGKLLLPAEGEGRNAVYAAGLGWKVKAFDQSSQAKVKAFELANSKMLHIDYEVSNFEEYEDELSAYDCIALIYAHFPKDKRRDYHRKLMRFLKPQGVVIIEGFSKEQIQNDSGGPKNVDMLFSKIELSEDFKGFKILDLEEVDVDLEEGKFHKGKASVIRLVAVKT